MLDTNVLKYAETKIVDGEEKTTTFAWITSIKITQRNAEKIANAGRCRWKIENQGFWSPVAMHDKAYLEGLLDKGQAPWQHLEDSNEGE